MIRKSYQYLENSKIMNQPLTTANESLEKTQERWDQRVRELHRLAKSANTQRAYRNDWQGFMNWCAEVGCACLPASPDDVARFVAARGDTHRISSIQRALVTIRQIHRAANLPDPTKETIVSEAIKGLRREKGVTFRGKAAATTDIIRQLVASLPDSFLGIRDRALLLIGFAGGFRRSELVGLDVSDLDFREDGLVITLRRSKTDPEGFGRQIGISYGSNPETCPVRRLKEWVLTAKLTEGPVFRAIDRHGHLASTRLTDQVVAKVIKRCAQRAGLNPKEFSGHSLRAGFVTSAALNDASDRQIMAQTGHRSRAMVDRYVREANLFRNNASGKLGL